MSFINDHIAYMQNYKTPAERKHEEVMYRVEVFSNVSRRWELYLCDSNESANESKVIDAYNIACKAFPINSFRIIKKQVTHLRKI